MKRLILCLMATLAAAMSVQAAGEHDADTIVEDSLEEDSIAVLAFFCLRDTMEYVFQSIDLETERGDTTVTSYYSTDVWLCVTDSTADGYRLEYSPTAFEREDTIKLDTKAVLHEHVFQRLKDRRMVFALTPEGEVTGMLNWRDIRDDLIQGVYAAYNELYPQVPGLEELVPKGQLLGLVSQRFQTEEGVRAWFDDIFLLLDFHGKLFPQRAEVDDEGNDQTYPSHTLILAGQEDEKAEFEGDYYVAVRTETHLSGADANDYQQSKVSILGEGNELGRLMAEANGEKELAVKETIARNYFCNGWPNSVTQIISEEGQSQSNMNLKTVDWKSRSWENY